MICIKLICAVGSLAGGIERQSADYRMNEERGTARDRVDGTERDKD